MSTICDSQAMESGEPEVRRATAADAEIFDVVTEIKDTVSVCLVEQNIIRALEISNRTMAASAR